jgi:hypothetical protein
VVLIRQHLIERGAQEMLHRQARLLAEGLQQPVFPRRQVHRERDLPG